MSKGGSLRERLEEGNKAQEMTHLDGDGQEKIFQVSAATKLKKIRGRLSFYPEVFSRASYVMPHISLCLRRFQKAFSSVGFCVFMSAFQIGLSDNRT